MRERSRGGDFVDHHIQYRFTTRPTSSSTSYLKEGEATRSRILFQQDTRDVITDGYHAKKSRNDTLPVNPFYGYRLIEQFSPGSFAWETGPSGSSYRPVWSQYITGDIAASMATSVYGKINLPDYPADDLAITRALVKVNTKGLDVGTFAAEFGKSVRLLSGAKSKLLRLIPDLVRVAKRKGFNWYDANSYTNALAEAWLEVRYGWRPLYYDMQSISAAINAMDDMLLPVERSSGFEISKDSDTWVEYSGLHGMVPGHGDVLRTLSSGKVFAERSVRCSLGAQTQVYSNIGYIDPITTAWELIPFSFIIDWFINVGDALRASSPFISRDVVYASLVREERYGAAWSTTVDGLLKTDPSLYFTLSDNSPAVGSIQIRRKERSSIVPASSVSARINLSVPKLADLAALVWSGFNRRR